MARDISRRGFRRPTRRRGGARTQARARPAGLRSPTERLHTHELEPEGPHPLEDAEELRLVAAGPDERGGAVASLERHASERSGKAFGKPALDDDPVALFVHATSLAARRARNFTPRDESPRVNSSRGTPPAAHPSPADRAAPAGACRLR